MYHSLRLGAREFRGFGTGLRGALREIVGLNGVVPHLWRVPVPKLQFVGLLCWKYIGTARGWHSSSEDAGQIHPEPPFISGDT